MCSAYNPFSLVLYLLVRCNNVQDWLVDKAYFFPFSLCSGIRTLNLRILSKLLCHYAMRAQPDFSTYTLPFPHSFFFSRNCRIQTLNLRILGQMFHHYAIEAQLAFTACFGMYTILFHHSFFFRRNGRIRNLTLSIKGQIFHHYSTEAQLAFTAYFNCLQNIQVKFILSYKFFYSCNYFHYAVS